MGKFSKKFCKKSPFKHWGGLFHKHPHDDSGGNDSGGDDESEDFDFSFDFSAIGNKNEILGLKKEVKELKEGLKKQNEQEPQDPNKTGDYRARYLGGPGGIKK